MVPRVLKRYKVSFDDCCVGGNFVATCTSVKYDDVETDYLDSVSFDNGVELTNIHGVSFEEV